MKKILVLAVTALALSGNAWAFGNSYGGDGGNGGNGGTGVGGAGYGGDAKAFGGHAGAIAGAAAGVNRSGNSNVDVRNRNRNQNNNRNKQGQLQGQIQGQQQGQIGINKNRVRTGDDRASVERSGNSKQGQIGINSQDGHVGAGNTTQFTDNSVYEAQKRNPVAPAWAAPLTATEDTCMGSSSAGGQGITLGFSFATTWRDDDCVRRKDARLLHNMQRPILSVGVLCDNERVLKAVTLAGSVQERTACGLGTSEPVAAVRATEDTVNTDRANDSDDAFAFQAGYGD